MFADVIIIQMCLTHEVYRCAHTHEQIPIIVCEHAHADADNVITRSSGYQLFLDLQGVHDCNCYLQSMIAQAPSSTADWLENSVH